MNPIRLVALTILLATSILATHETQAQQLGGTKRKDLLRQELSVQGREVIQVLVEFSPGLVAPRHSHPGEEIAYVIEGELEYQLDGRPPVTLKAGDTLFIPAGHGHAVRNVGSGKAIELATYIVERGKPLVTVK